MFTQARITAYDLMETVTITALVWRGQDDYDGEPLTRTFSCTFNSTGENDRARWLRDALVALAETL
jgi:hypothetical protein